MPPKKPPDETELQHPKLKELLGEYYTLQNLKDLVEQLGIHDVRGKRTMRKTFVLALNKFAKSHPEILAGIASANSSGLSAPAPESAAPESSAAESSSAAKDLESSAAPESSAAETTQESSAAGTSAPESAAGPSTAQSSAASKNLDPAAAETLAKFLGKEIEGTTKLGDLRRRKGGKVCFTIKEMMYFRPEDEDAITAVFKAELDDGDLVAVKAHISKGKRMGSGLYREAHILSSLSNLEHFIHLRGYVEVETSLETSCFLIMQYVPMNLAQLAGKITDEGYLCKIIRSAIVALQVLHHKAERLHMDIKPANFLVDEDGNVMLCDFGDSEKSRDKPEKKYPLGTVAWRSLSQDIKALDKRSTKNVRNDDLEALGYTFATLVGGAGALPWFVLACKCAGSGSREDLMELIKMKQERKFIFPPSLQSVAVKIEQYFQLLSKMTSTDSSKEEDYAALMNIFEVR